MRNRMKLFIFLSIISLCFLKTADSTDVRELVIQEKTTETVSVPMAAISEVVENVEPTASTALALGAEELSKETLPNPPAGKREENIVSEKSVGKSSYYDYKLKSGWSSKGHFVCASRDYPRGSMLLVTNLANGKSVTCKVTDYGPDIKVFPDRIIDLSSASFAAIAKLSAGVIKVSVAKEESIKETPKIEEEKVLEPVSDSVTEVDSPLSITSGRMIELTNLSRIEVGLSPLVENTKLSQAAKMKAEDMLTKQYFEHTSPEGISPWHWFELAGYKYIYAGENLAIDFVTEEGAHAAFMKSTTHRENILGENYKEIGIAVIKGTFEGKETLFIVEEFGLQRI